jgi:hypothetical protein
MALTDYVDLYCERLTPGLWGEPLNTLSNVGFLLAGLLLVLRLRTAQAAIPLSVRALPALLLCIFLGSLAFHMLANVWSGWLDTGFILAFACVFFYAFFRHMARAPAWLSLAAAFIFFWLSFGAKYWMPGFGLNGSEAYLPMLIGLFAMTLYLARDPSAFGHFFAATVVLCASIALRTIDRTVCDAWPYGTHFVWHLLNALLLYILTVAVIDKYRGTKKP